MKVRDVKIGDRYYAYGCEGPLIAKSIQKADRKNGIWDTTVLCVDSGNGNQERHYPANLTPWEEHLANQRMQDMETADTLQGAQEIIDAIGEGATIAFSGPRFVRIWFTEPAAERALELLGANPLPDNRRPSLIKDHHCEEWERLCVLLSQRLKRAFRAGYAGSWLSDSLKPPYVAELYFYYDVEEAARNITGREEEGGSELAELIA